MVKEWFGTHWKRVLVHGLILSGFLVYAFFLADPLFNKFEVLEGESRLVMVVLPSPTNNIQYGLERFTANDTSLRVEGWAYIEGQSAEDSWIYIVLKSAENTYAFATSPRQRGGITDPDALDLKLDEAGFLSIIPLRNIKEGGYNLGLFIRKGGIEALQYTDKGFVKSGNTIKVISP
jgi:hypothetical protein